MSYGQFAYLSVQTYVMGALWNHRVMEILLFVYECPIESPCHGDSIVCEHLSVIIKYTPYLLLLCYRYSNTKKIICKQHILKP